MNKKKVVIAIAIVILVIVCALAIMFYGNAMVDMMMRAHHMR